MSSDLAKYHHRVPKAYLKKWCFSGQSICFFNKEETDHNIVWRRRNIDNVLGENRFYSIMAGSVFTTPEALDKIFAPLENYKVFFDEKGKRREIVDKIELNDNYWDHEKWIIEDLTGKQIASKCKRVIFNKISQIADNSIEELWGSMYENNWYRTIEGLEKLAANDRQLTGDEYHKLIEYFVMFQWRARLGYRMAVLLFNLLENEKLDIMQSKPKNKRYKSVAEEIWHNYLLCEYYSFLTDRGSMRQEVELYYSNLTPVFIFDLKDRFYTSDNPCFLYTNSDGYNVHIFVASPRLIVELFRKDPESPDAYKIMIIETEEVERYNQLIILHGTEIVSNDQSLLPENH